MSITPDALIRQWFDELWNQGDATAIDRYMGPDTKFHGLATPDGRPLTGPSGFRPFYANFHEAFPDVRVEVVRTITEGELVACHCHVTGTHSGPGLGVTPSGKRGDFWGIVIGHIRDGKIVEGWNCFDFLTLYQQLGIMPMAGA